MAAFTPDDATLVTGGYDGTVRFWDVREGKEVRRLKAAEIGDERNAKNDNWRFPLTARRSSPSGPITIRPAKSPCLARGERAHSPSGTRRPASSGRTGRHLTRTTATSFQPTAGGWPSKAGPSMTRPRANVG